MLLIFSCIIINTVWSVVHSAQLGIGPTYSLVATSEAVNQWPNSHNPSVPKIK